VIVLQAAHSPAAGNAVVDVMLLGEIDVTNVPSLSRYLRRILDRSASGLIFDLTGVRFLDCAAARAIVGIGRMLPDGQRPVLRRPTWQARHAGRCLSSASPPGSGRPLAAIENQLRAKDPRLEAMFRVFGNRDPAVGDSSGCPYHYAWRATGQAP